MADAHFIDSNVLLRYLLGDHPQQSNSARALIQSIAEGKLGAWTTELVISEMVYVLSGPVVGRERREIAEALQDLLEIPGLRLDGREVVRAALETWATVKVDWADAYHATLVVARGESRLYSFDRDFDRLSGVERMEPGREG